LVRERRRCIDENGVEAHLFPHREQESRHPEKVKKAYISNTIEIEVV
jgi:hypothetical protein